VRGFHLRGGAAPTLPISLRLDPQHLQTSFKPIQVTGLPQEFEEWQPNLITATALADLRRPHLPKPRMPVAHSGRLLPLQDFSRAYARFGSSASVFAILADSLL
jgi:hypothetical protein